MKHPQEIEQQKRALNEAWEGKLHERAKSDAEGATKRYNEAQEQIDGLTKKLSGQ